MRRTAISGGLLAAVICWVALLSLMSPASNTVQTVIVPAADGSRCVIKFVDKSRFTNSSTPGVIALRMDILDGAGKPIVNLKDADFEVIEEDLPGRVTSFRGPQGQVINLILVIDVSGSMSTDNRIEGAKQSAIAVLEALKVDRDRLAIIPFSSTMQVLRPLEVLTSANRSLCRELIEALEPSGGTRIGPPTLESLNLYQKQPIDGAKMVMVMTDGEDPEFARHIEAIAQLGEEAGAQVHTIGFGGEVGPAARAALQEVARRCSGQYQHAPSNEELTRIFNARVQETINECTLVYDSPYPQPDGLPRKVELRLKAPNGVVNAAFSYQVGPLLGGRSTPAPWAMTKGKTAPTEGVMSFVFPLMLFAVLFSVLVAGLVIPEFALSRSGGASNSNAPVASSAHFGMQPSRSTIPLPPPPTKTAPSNSVSGVSTPAIKTASNPSSQPVAHNPIDMTSPPRSVSSQQPAIPKPLQTLPPPPSRPT